MPRQYHDPDGIQFRFPKQQHTDSEDRHHAPLRTRQGNRPSASPGIRQTLGRGSEEGAAKVGIKWPNGRPQVESAEQNFYRSL